MDRGDRIVAALTVLALAVVFAPMWFFVGRLWWELTHAVLTLPWSELIQAGEGGQ